MASGDYVDVVVVGAGPTGLTLGTQLAAFGVSVLVVDAKAGPVAESRAPGDPAAHLGGPAR
jgi:3-(3-hydroxy-phenyl)propionate hydroxylase